LPEPWFDRINIDRARAQRFPESDPKKRASIPRCAPGVGRAWQAANR
jgi:hypothetical protein